MPDIQGCATHPDGWIAWLISEGYMPPYPDDNRVPLVTTPVPPQLPKHTTDARDCEILAAAYRAGHKVHYGKETKVLMRGAANYKYAHLLITGAAALRRHEVSPIAWAVWRFPAWYKRKKPAIPSSLGKPPVHWVFRAESVDKFRGWFRSETDARYAPRMQPVAAHRELVGRWAVLQARVLVAPRTVEAVLEAVRQVFPDDLYPVLLQEAQVESERATRSLARRVARGQWIW